jgi:AcrR family transcriptional regulator
MRSIAAEAGVDQKLVGYFFGSKQALFVAATELPFDPGGAICAVFTGDPAAIGDRLARFVVGLLENPDAGTRLIGLVRAAAAEPEAARLVRELFTREVWAPAAAALPSEQPELAINLVASQLLGLVMARYVIGVEPLTSMSPEAVAASIAPTLQRHLATGVEGRAVEGQPRRGRSRS